MSSLDGTGFFGGINRLVKILKFVEGVLKVSRCTPKRQQEESDVCNDRDIPLWAPRGRV